MLYCTSGLFGSTLQKYFAWKRYILIDKITLYLPWTAIAKHWYLQFSIHCNPKLIKRLLTLPLQYITFTICTLLLKSVKKLHQITYSLNFFLQSIQDLSIRMLLWQCNWIFEFTIKSNVGINFSAKILNSPAQF